LQSCVAESQRALGGAWLDRYLTAPVWRFILTPGVLGARGWAGVLLPSVDRVGRYFPLTVCASIDGIPLDRGAIAQLSPWLDRTEAAARACLAHDATVNGFEDELLSIGLPHVQAPHRSSQGTAGALLQRMSPLTVSCDASGPDLALLADELLANALSGYSLWWQASGAAFLNLNLPASSRYTQMIDHASAR
jgi:type VI secretion system protein ImpM